MPDFKRFSQGAALPPDLAMIALQQAAAFLQELLPLLLLLSNSWPVTPRTTKTPIASKIKHPQPISAYLRPLPVLPGTGCIPGVPGGAPG